MTEAGTEPRSSRLGGFYQKSVALTSISETVPGSTEERRQCLAEALAAARRIDGDWTKANALSGLAPHLPADREN